MHKKRDLDWSDESVRKVIRRHHDEIDLKRAQIQNGVLDMIADAAPDQLAMAKDPGNRNAANAFRNLSEIGFPRGGGGVQVNIAGRDVVAGGGQVANIDAPPHLKEILELPDDQIDERIKAIEAEFSRPAPPREGS